MKSQETNYWRALQRRDAEFDGVFYYGVSSTGVFCRPSCRSKQPKRENVVFFTSPEVARRAGFRSCLRCRPDRAELKDPQAELVQRICRAIEANPEDSPGLARLSSQTGFSQSHLHRVFKRLMGITPRQYAEALRADRFKTQVRGGRAVTEAMYEAGYSSSSRLYEKAAAQLGMTPATYRRGGKGMRINYTIVNCRLGRLLVAATERGICSVTLGDSDEALERALRSEFPKGEIARDETSLSGWVKALLAHLDGQQPRLDLPLDVQATAFQKRVWEELRRIPYGSTASYAEIARRIGQPTATRAVARACATNPTALITPCHRVVREGGDTSGYRWGVERKRELLALEKRNTAGQASAAKGR
ncbi:MAG TPA: bifunctional DNA-binding transcriptional regulator/O6-methylguanine-DNA methyltransferase Ada [Blastocatellia bacterium]|nr:bifunctional DNA-binding transcriptional regulator/O6-methylguanine-DNA methyltransferase Ada [Blastocatellia bacterium]